MRDLKHLITFENLLENADNELVEKAKQDGKLAIGYTCYHIPEVLLNVDNCFSVRLRAPRTGSIDISTYYMSNYTCEFARSLVERGIEGGFQFLDGLAGVDACSAMNRFYEHFEILKMNHKEKFFVTHTDMPYKVTDYSVRHYVKQMKIRLLDVMHENLGVDISDAAIRKAVEEHNKVCRILTEIGEMRKADNPVITGYEYHILNLVSYTCPKYLILPYLEETLEELKTREPEEKNPFRVRVVVVGSETDDTDLIKLIEESGAYVCADRYCYGSLPGRDPIILNDDEDALTQICRQYMQRGQCPRYMNTEKMISRRQYVADLAKEYGADGIIYQQMKFCDPWAYEKMLGSHILREDFGYPVLAVDRPYAVAGSGQLRTRVQAFVESVELKKIQGGAQNG